MIQKISQFIREKKTDIRKRCRDHFIKIKNDPYFVFISTLALNENTVEDIYQQFQSKPDGKLTGILIGIKDNIVTKDFPTTAASRILEHFHPDYDATVVTKIKKENGIIVGKTNLDEFAMGSSTEYSYFGPTKNPVNPEYVPGGSSGGSAAAVRAGFVDVALGSDTGGSVRLPASFTGTVGFKPSYGRISRFGLIAFASSLDHIGIHARNIDDVKYIFEIIQGKDPLDSTSVDVETVSNFLPKKVKEKESIRIGIPTFLLQETKLYPIQPIFKNLVSLLKSMGFTITYLESLDWQLALKAYYVLSSAEASSNLARYDGVRYGHREPFKTSYSQWIQQNRSKGFGPEVKRRILLGNFVLSKRYHQNYYTKAAQIRREFALLFKNYFQKVDVVVTPTSPMTAFPFGVKLKNPVDMYQTDLFTVPANLTGIPAISIPAGNDEKGLPVGIQIMGDLYQDEFVLDIASILEKSINER